MISLDFDYYAPDSIEEALELFTTFKNMEKDPLFFNGGTEIITMMRINALYTNTKVLIDIKNIPACTFTGYEQGKLVIGASVPLAFIEETPDFPLLSKVCNRIADHTSREKITLGGNICGSIKYKEAILPLLLTNAELVIANSTGVHTVAMNEIYNERLGKIMLDHGSFITQIQIDQHYGNMPFMNEKITSFGRIGYPLITVSAIKVNDRLHFAFSGLCEAPFRSLEIEDSLNKSDIPLTDRITRAIQQIPRPILEDTIGSAEFREFTLRNVLKKISMELGGSQSC